jgi:hypothetical protein
LTVLRADDVFGWTTLVENDMPTCEPYVVAHEVQFEDGDVVVFA